MPDREDFWREYKRRHPLEYLAARLDVLTEEVMLAIGTPLYRLLVRLGILKAPHV